ASSGAARAAATSAATTMPPRGNPRTIGCSPSYCRTTRTSCSPASTRSRKCMRPPLTSQEALHELCRLLSAAVLHPWSDGAQCAELLRGPAGDVEGGDDAHHAAFVIHHRQPMDVVADHHRGGAADRHRLA